MWLSLTSNSFINVNNLSFLLILRGDGLYTD